MAIESQESTLVFDNEEARQAAMDALDDRPENESKIDEILRAPLKQSDDAADKKPAEPDTFAPPPPPPPSEPAVEKKPSAGDEIVFTLKRSELPEGFDTPGKVFKSYREAQDLISRQTKFIKEKLGGEGSSTQELQAALKKATDLEAQLAETRKQLEKPAPTDTTRRETGSVPQSKAPQIRSLNQQLQELVKDPIANEEEIHRLNLQLNSLLIDENERNQLLIERAAQRAEQAERQANEAQSKANGWIAKSEQSEQSKRATEALQKEYQDIDAFTGDKDYSEFRMSKPAAQVEQDYVRWAQDVANLYYGAKIDIFNPDGNKAMKHALLMLERGAPDIAEKCRVAGVAMQPTDDVKKYLEICELLDYRDGYRPNAATGQRELVQRWHGPTQKYVPDTFPSLRAAYEDRKIRDGYYAKRIRDAFVSGGQQMADAISRRESGAVEMDNAAGTSKRDAGLSMTVQEAQKIIDEIDEIDAIRRKKQGDSSQYDRLNQAFLALKMSPLD